MTYNVMNGTLIPTHSLPEGLSKMCLENVVVLLEVQTEGPDRF